MILSLATALSGCWTNDGPPSSCVIPDPPTDMLEEIADGRTRAVPGTNRWIAQVFAVMGWGVDE